MLNACNHLELNNGSLSPQTGSRNRCQSKIDFLDAVSLNEMEQLKMTAKADAMRVRLSNCGITLTGLTHHDTNLFNDI